MKTILAIGLDGATWDILQPMVEKGELPNIKRIIQLGCYGDLESVLPPVTCPAWKCYSTGKNPGKLGVFWWVDFDKEEAKIVVPNSYSFKSKDLWDYLGEKDMNVGVINMPTTYPPKKVNGFMISGFGMPLGDFDWHQPYTYPKELQKEIEEKYGYEVGIRDPNRMSKEELTKKIYRLIQMRFDLLEDKLREGRWDFIHTTVFYINVLQHFYGRDESVENGWKIIDENLGKFLDKGYNIFIFSDHGSMQIEGSFFINNWLMREGYLKVKKDFGDIISRSDDALIWLFHLKRRYISGILRRILPSPILSKMPGMDKPLSVSMIDTKIDWENSDAVAVSMGPIYINKKRVGAKYIEVREEMIRKLKSLEDSESGKKPIERCYRKEEIYKGPYLEKAPDILILPSYGYEIYGGISDELFQRRRISWTTGNHPKGIFMAFGPDIRNGVRLVGMKITDIAPTILHLHNVSVPKDMDGRVFKEIFKENTDSFIRGVVYSNEDNMKALKAKIRELKGKGKI